MLASLHTWVVDSRPLPVPKLKKQNGKINQL